MKFFKKKKKTNKRSWRGAVIFYFLTITGGFLLQTSIFPLIPALLASPNILLIMTFSTGYIHGNVYGMTYGFLSGLLLDLFYSGPFGFYTLIFIFIGYFSGSFNRYFYEEYISLPMMLCLVSSLLYHFYIYIFRFLIRQKLDIFYYIIHTMLPSVVFSMLVTVFLYRFFFSASGNDRIRKGWGN